MNEKKLTDKQASNLDFILGWNMKHLHALAKDMQEAKIDADLIKDLLEQIEYIDRKYPIHFTAELKFRLINMAEKDYKLIWELEGLAGCFLARAQNLKQQLIYLRKKTKSCRLTKIIKTHKDFHEFKN